MKRLVEELLVAFQFLTRLPVSRIAYHPDSLSRSAKFFPVVGLVIGLGASVLQHILAPHLNRMLVALVDTDLSCTHYGRTPRRRVGGYGGCFWWRLESGAGSHDPAG